MRYYDVKNVGTGEVLGLENEGRLDRLEEYRRSAEFVRMMNLEHVAGCEHVLECHDGKAQSYRIVDLEDGHLIDAGDA